MYPYVIDGQSSGYSIPLASPPALVPHVFSTKKVSSSIKDPGRVQRLQTGGWEFNWVAIGIREQRARSHSLRS